MNLPPPFEFDCWRVEPDRNALVSSDGESRLGARVMAVLVVLAGSGGRVVTREELLETVWDGRAVTDDALTVAVHDLRKALGDRANAPRFVETITGRGYRWLVPICEAATRASPAAARAQAQPPRHRWHSRLLLVTGLALGAAAGVLAVGLRSDGWLRDGSATLPVSSGRIQPDIARAALDANELGVTAAAELTPAGYRRAAAHFERAAALAPDFSVAHVHLADALLNLSYFPSAQRAALSTRARAEVGEALALDPTLPGAHLLRGIVSMILDWDLEAAEQDFWRAIQLDADYAPAHERYAMVLAAQGRFAAAEVRLRHAVELAPSIDRYTMALGQLLFSLGRSAEALEVLQPGETWEPPMLHYAWFLRGRALEALGREVEACAADLEFLLQALPQLDLTPYQRACDRGGPKALHGLWLESLEAPTNLYLRAVFSLELGREGEALSWLWQMHRERDPLLLWIGRDPLLEALADHPEFQRLIAAIRPHDPDDLAAVSATSHPAWALQPP